MLIEMLHDSRDFQRQVSILLSNNMVLKGIVQSVSDDGFAKLCSFENQDQVATEIFNTRFIMAVSWISNPTFERFNKVMAQWDR